MAVKFLCFESAWSVVYEGSFVHVSTAPEAAVGGYLFSQKGNDAASTVVLTESVTGLPTQLIEGVNACPNEVVTSSSENSSALLNNNALLTAGFEPVKQLSA